jgi:hypothetical protein
MGALIHYLKQRKRILKRVRKLRNADVVVVSHAKSGRTWLAAMISHVYHQQYGIDEATIIRFDNFHRLNQEIPRIFFTHDNRKLPDQTPLASLDSYANKKVVLLVRDPRDVAVSLHFHSTRRNRRGSATGLYDAVIGIRMPVVIKFLNRWAENISSIEQSLIIRYEDLRARPYTELARVMEFISGECSPDTISKAVDFASFENLRAKEERYFFTSARLHPGDPNDPESFKVRRGKVGGYRDYFTPEQLARIDAMVADGLGDKFGYRRETSPTATRNASNVAL